MLQKYEEMILMKMKQMTKMKELKRNPLTKCLLKKLKMTLVHLQSQGTNEK